MCKGENADGGNVALEIRHNGTDADRDRRGRLCIGSGFIRVTLNSIPNFQVLARYTVDHFLTRTFPCAFVARQFRFFELDHMRDEEPNDEHSAACLKIPTFL